MSPRLLRELLAMRYILIQVCGHAYPATIWEAYWLDELGHDC